MPTVGPERDDAGGGPPGAGRPLRGVQGGVTRTPARRQTASPFAMPTRVVFFPSFAAKHLSIVLASLCVVQVAARAATGTCHGHGLRGK